VGKRHRVVKDPRLTNVVRKIIRSLGMSYIDVNRVAVVRNLDSTSCAYARIYSVPKPIAVAFDTGPLYAIEIIHRNFEKLDCESKLRVLIHELLHIPKNFSGSLLPHRASVFSSSRIESLLRRLELQELCKELEYK